LHFVRLFQFVSGSRAIFAYVSAYVFTFQIVRRLKEGRRRATAFDRRPIFFLCLTDFFGCGAPEEGPALANSKLVEGSRREGDGLRLSEGSASPSWAGRFFFLGLADFFGFGAPEGPALAKTPTLGRRLGPLPSSYLSLVLGSRLAAVWDLTWLLILL